VEEGRRSGRNREKRRRRRRDDGEEDSDDENRSSFILEGNSNMGTSHFFFLSPAVVQLPSSCGGDADD